MCVCVSVVVVVNLLYIYHIILLNGYMTGIIVYNRIS